MDDEERSTRKEQGRLPRLTRLNWNSEFIKSAFKDMALNYGEAGSIIIRDQDIVLREPDYDMLVLIPDPNNPEQLIPGDQRFYPNDAIGWRRFERDEKRYSKLKENKMKLLNKLFEAMEREIRDKMTQSPGYQAAYDGNDLLALWHMAEQICVGRGAVSVYQLVFRIMRMSQKEEYTSYAKEFKDAVTDLRRQVNGNNFEELLNIIMNVLFIIGLNQDQFKDRLTEIYGTRNWPAYEVLSAELEAYVENIEKVDNLKRGDEGKIKANAAKFMEEGYREGCWNCGSTDHFKRECKKALVTCEICGGRGHLAMFCLRKKEDNRDNEGHDNKHQDKKKEGKNVKSKEARSKEASKERSSKEGSSQVIRH